MQKRKTKTPSKARNVLLIILVVLIAISILGIGIRCSTRFPSGPNTIRPAGISLDKESIIF